jgi:formylmethanofuran dehydrogenase subunit E
MKYLRIALLPAILLYAALAFSQPANVDAVLKQVAEFHGNAGVFAVAGYRMGQRALLEFHEQRGSFDLDVTHRTPLEVQYSCIADGWQAATGVSAGKLNLHVIPVPAADLETIIKDRKSGQRLTFRLKPDFLKAYLNVPYDKQAAAARRVALMPEEQIYSMQK